MHPRRAAKGPGPVERPTFVCCRTRRSQTASSTSSSKATKTRAIAGLALSGESPGLFRQRLAARITRGIGVRAADIMRIVDFGCGLGHSVPYLVGARSPARPSSGSTRPRPPFAPQGEHYGSARVRVHNRRSALEDRLGDLAYSNGTFHHIEPDDRTGCRRPKDRRWLAPRGLVRVMGKQSW